MTNGVKNPTFCKKEVSGMRVFVSDLLEKVATNEEKDAGFDLADYLIQIPLKDFREKPENPDNSQTVGIHNTNKDSLEFILHYTALSEREKETNGSETRAPEKNEFIAPPDPDVHLPKIVEAETRVSGPTSIDIDEYRRWAKTLRPFSKGEFVRLDSMVDDSPYNKVFNPRAFAMGRLNSVAAWANARNDTGPKALHIRQLIELRQKLSINQ